MKFAILSSFAIASVNAAGGSVFDYKTNGADWPTAYPTCGGKN